MTAKMKTRSTIPSRETTFPYELDYFNHLLARESRKEGLFSFKARSPQLNHRKSLIGLLILLAKKLHLASTTVHLAARILDLFMDNHDILPKQLKLTASSCLLIAAKYVDTDQNIPKTSHLQSLTDSQNSLLEYSQMEKMLFNFLGWDLNFATTADFLEVLLPWGQQFTLCDSRMEHNTCDPSDFKFRATQFANMTLAEDNFINMKPSLVAASCLAATRAEFNMYPIWPQRLEQLLGYSHIDLKGCLQNIYYNRLEQHPVLRFIPPSVHIVQTTQSSVNITQSWEDPRNRFKLKAPPVTYNYARTRRQLIQTRDLKRMYCAM